MGTLTLWLFLSEQMRDTLTPVVAKAAIRLFFVRNEISTSGLRAFKILRSVTIRLAVPK